MKTFITTLGFAVCFREESDLTASDYPRSQHEIVLEDAAKQIEQLQREKGELRAYSERLYYAFHRAYACIPDIDMYHDDFMELSLYLEETPAQPLHDHDVEVAERVLSSVKKLYKERKDGESFAWLLNNLKLEDVQGGE